MQICANIDLLKELFQKRNEKNLLHVQPLPVRWSYICSDAALPNIKHFWANVVKYWVIRYVISK